MNRLLPLALAAGALAATTSAQVTLTELATIDLSSTANTANPQYIGTNASAVAWDGTRLFVAGNNNAPSGTTNCSIVEVLGPLSGSPTFGTPFGTLSTTFFRGYIGLDVQGNRLAAAYDPGSAHPNGIQCFDLSGALQWPLNARGGSSTGFDPGFRGSVGGQGVAWTTFGSGRRALNDTATGSVMWDLGSGMVISYPGQTTYFWRDVDFDPRSGDLWARASNNVVHAVRGGDNAISQVTVPFDPVDADFVAFQNIAFCDTPTGDFVIFNDRGSASTNQGFFQTVLALRADGAPATLDFGTFNPTPGSAAYDFSWDSRTSTLAILDFTNRNVHIFGVGYAPYYRYGSGCPGSSGATPELAGVGQGTIGTTLTYQLSNGVANGQGFVLLGFGQGSLPLYSGCDVLVSPLLPVTLGPLPLDGTGAGNVGLTIIPNTSGVTLTAQGIMIDLGVTAPLPFILTNGLKLVIP